MGARVPGEGRCVCTSGGTHCERLANEDVNGERKRQVMSAEGMVMCVLLGKGKLCSQRGLVRPQREMEGVFVEEEGKYVSRGIGKLC